MVYSYRSSCDTSRMHCTSSAPFRPGARAALKWHRNLRTHVPRQIGSPTSHLKVNDVEWVPKTGQRYTHHTAMSVEIQSGHTFSRNPSSRFVRRTGVQFGNVKQLKKTPISPSLHLLPQKQKYSRKLTSVGQAFCPWKLAAA